MDPQTSSSEALGVLALMELIVVLCLAGPKPFDVVDLEMGLPLANSLFAPWWFLGHVTAVVTDDSETVTAD